MCYAHNLAVWEGRELKPLTNNKPLPKCKFNGCEKEKVALGLCAGHRSQQKSKGELKPLRTYAQKEHKRINSSGYVLIFRPEHPNAQKRGTILEHVYVMSEHIGRPLLPNENIHHKNGVRCDNRIENLELWCVNQPKGQRVSDLLDWAVELLDTYADYQIRSKPDEQN